MLSAAALSHLQALAGEREDPDYAVLHDVFIRRADFLRWACGCLPDAPAFWR